MPTIGSGESLPSSFVMVKVKGKQLARYEIKLKDDKNLYSEWHNIKPIVILESVTLTDCITEILDTFETFENVIIIRVKELGKPKSKPFYIMSYEPQGLFVKPF